MLLIIDVAEKTSTLILLSLAVVVVVIAVVEPAKQACWVVTIRIAE